MKSNRPFILENNFEKISKEPLEKILEKYSYTAITVTLTGNYPEIYRRFVERNNELQFASFTCYYDFKYQTWLEKLKLERLKLSFYMSDIFRISTVKTERGLDYPYARTFSFSLSATF